METATEERFVWTSQLVGAVLALRFTDGEMRKHIESAKGNQSKREAWTALAERLHREQGVCIPENKIRRAISKWQSQHRAWVNATAGKSAEEAALTERPPSYMRILDQYFKQEFSPRAVAPIQPQNKVVATDVTPSTVQNAPNLVPKDDSDSGSSAKSDLELLAGRTASKTNRHVEDFTFTSMKVRKIGADERSQTPTSPPRSLTLSPEGSQYCSPRLSKIPHFRDPNMTLQMSAGSSQAMQALVSLQHEQISLQKLHFHQMLTLQRQQYEAQFDLQHKHVEALRGLIHSITSDVRV